jgi:hypothetical protein
MMIALSQLTEITVKLLPGEILHIELSLRWFKKEPGHQVEKEAQCITTTQKIISMVVMVLSEHRFP